MIHHNTGSGANIVVSWALGFEPWNEVDEDDPRAVKVKNKYYKRSSLGITPPVRIRITGEDWEHHIGEVIVPELKKWAPAGEYVTKKNNQGVEAKWTWKNRSTFEIMTYNMDAKLFEAWLGDGWWADEPPPKPIYTAMARGLFGQGGKTLLTMTPLSEAWILDDLILSGRRDVGVIKELDIRANEDYYEHDRQILELGGVVGNHLNHYYDLLLFEDDRGRQAEDFLAEMFPVELHDSLSKIKFLRFIKDCPVDQKPSRVFGQFKELVGLILKGFKEEVHIVKAFDVPPDWPVVPIIDIHLNKPNAISFYSISPHGIWFVIDEVWENLSPEKMANLIIKKMQRNVWRIEEVFIDPLAKGDTAYIKNRFADEEIQDSFTIISEKLEEFGITLLAATKDKDSGIRNLQTELEGVNNLALLYFFDTLQSVATPGAYGHVFEIRRWVYDDDNKPKKECVVGSTLIDTPGGRFPIKDLVGENPYVYCYNTQEMRFDVKKALKIKLVKRKAEIWKLTMDRGVLFATPEHMVMLRDGKYKQLKDLRSYESLMAIYRTLSVDGYAHINYAGIRNKYRMSEHRYVYQCTNGEIPIGHEVHHKDCNYLNHNPDNLKCVSSTEHQAIHILKGEEKVCRNCGNIFKAKRVYQKYCTAKCSQSYHDKLRGRKIEKYCKYCLTKLKLNSRQGRKEYCNSTCKGLYYRNLRCQKLINHKVISVGFYGYEDVYDMTVEGHHNYVANDIVVHNCDHFMENMYRKTLTGVIYTDLKKSSDPLGGESQHQSTGQGWLAG